MIWIAAVFALLVLAIWLWLAVLPIGLGINGFIGPNDEYPIEGRVVSGSPFGKLVRRFRGKDGDDPASGIVVFGRAHFAGNDAGPYLICHEIGHLVSAMRVGRWSHTLRYLTDGGFAKADEEWAHDFALKYQSDGLVRILFERMAKAEQKRTGSVTKVAGGAARLEAK